MDAIFLECLVFHNALEKIKMGWRYLLHNTKGKIMFCVASGWVFKLQTPDIKHIRYPHRAKLSRAYMSPGLWSTRNGLRLGSWAGHSGGMVRLCCSPHFWAFLIWIQRGTWIHREPGLWSASKKPFRSLRELHRITEW